MRERSAVCANAVRVAGVQSYTEATALLQTLDKAHILDMSPAQRMCVPLAVLAACAAATAGEVEGEDYQSIQVSVRTRIARMYAHARDRARGRHTGARAAA